MVVKLALSRLPLAAAMVTGLLSCKERPRQTDDMPVPTKSRPDGHSVDLARPQGDPAVVSRKPGVDGPAPGRAAMTDVDLEQIREVLPALEDLSVVEGLANVPHGRLARLTLCPRKTSLDALTADLVSRFRKAGWKDVTTNKPPHDSRRRSITANRSRFRMTGSIHTGNFTDCHQDQHGTRVSISISERAPGIEADPKLVPTGHAIGAPSTDKTRAQTR